MIAAKQNTTFENLIPKSIQSHINYSLADGSTSVETVPTSKSRSNDNKTYKSVHHKSRISRFNLEKPLNKILNSFRMKDDYSIDAIKEESIHDVLVDTVHKASYSIQENHSKEFKNKQMAYLRTIDEIYAGLQTLKVAKSPFIKHKKNEGTSLFHFMDFICNKWTQKLDETPESVLKIPVKRRPTLFSFLPIKRLSQKQSVMNSPKTVTIEEKFTKDLESYKKVNNKKIYDDNIAINKKNNPIGIAALNEINLPTIPKANIVDQTRESCRQFYIKKREIHNLMLSKLESKLSERSFANRIKKECLNSSREYDPTQNTFNKISKDAIKFSNV